LPDDTAPEDSLIASDNRLPAQARTTLQALVGTMIPKSDEYGVPGADDPAIFEEILAAVRPYLPLMTEHMALLEQLRPDQPQEHDGAFANLSYDARLQRARQFLVAYPAVAALLVSLTTQCYYRDGRVMESLGMEARAPFPKGFEIEQGDWSLLDPVRARGPIFREVFNKPE